MGQRAVTSFGTEVPAARWGGVTCGDGGPTANGKRCWRTAADSLSGGWEKAKASTGKSALRTETMGSAVEQPSGERERARAVDSSAGGVEMKAGRMKASR